MGHEVLGQSLFTRQHSKGAHLQALVSRPSQRLKALPRVMAVEGGVLIRAQHTLLWPLRVISDHVYKLADFAYFLSKYILVFCGPVGLLCCYHQYLLPLLPRICLLSFLSFFLEYSLRPLYFCFPLLNTSPWKEWVVFCLCLWSSFLQVSISSVTSTKVVLNMVLGWKSFEDQYVDLSSSVYRNRCGRHDGTTGWEETSALRAG